MKIILCHNQFQITGGAEFFYHEVGRVLQENGHEVAFFSAEDQSSTDSAWSNYFPAVADYSSGSQLSRALALPNMIYNRQAKERMGQLIRDFKPDLIHAFAIYVKLTPSILDAAREAGVPVVMSCNDYKLICPNYKLFHHGHVCEACKGGKFYQAVVNRCCHDSLAYSVASSLEAYAHNAMNIYRKNVHTFLFASEFMASKTKDFWGDEKFRWRKLNNPFNAKKFEYSEISENYILYFGRLIDEKGVDVLLSAMALLPDVRLIVVGDGPDRAVLEQQSQEQGLKQVEFAGPKWGSELDIILSRCRFVVVPSLWHENFPYVILQAFAFGKPVVGSMRGGITELVSHGERGLVYESTNAQALAANIRQLWDDQAATLSMGRAAKDYVDEAFNDETFYMNLMAIYQEVLA
jgi:glycosyltransferase involved in cell wall biosynthesis